MSKMRPWISNIANDTPDQTGTILRAPTTQKGRRDTKWLSRDFLAGAATASSFIAVILGLSLVMAIKDKFDIVIVPKQQQTTAQAIPPITVRSTGSSLPMPPKSATMAADQPYDLVLPTDGDPLMGGESHPDDSAPAPARTTLRAAETALANHKVAEAIDDLHGILAAEPDNFAARSMLVDALNQHGEYEDAATEARQLLITTPHDDHALHGLALALSHLGTPEAFSEIQVMVKQHPYDAALVSALGAMYAQNGDVDKAADYYKRAITLAPDVLAYRLNLASSYDRAGQSNEAIALYRDVLARAYDRDHPEQAGIPLADINARLGYLADQ